MTDREKLIELLLAGMGFTDNKQLLIPTSELYHLADYLISHGVGVRGKGEWVGDSKEECPFCGERSKWFYENFCPNCGANLRGEQHEP